MLRVAPSRRPRRQARWIGTHVNVAPTANAGVDQSVNTSTLVTLNGTASSDPDGTIAGYTWRQISGTAVTLSSTSVASPTFTSPASSATLVFGLVVTDNLAAASSEDTVTVVVSAPVTQGWDLHVGRRRPRIRVWR